MLFNLLHALVLCDLILFFFLDFAIIFILFINILVASYYHRDFLKLAIATIPRDVKGVHALVSIERDYRRRAKAGCTIGAIFEEKVKLFPHKTAFIDLETKREWTFYEFNQLTNQIANYFDAEGLKPGDVVALFASNCPEYIAIWLGLSKIGVITALINSNLRFEPLGHSIRISNAKCVILGSEFQTVYEETVKAEHLESSKNPIYVLGEGIPKISEAKNLFFSLANVSKLSPPKKEGVDFKSVLIYIYTSGTTGLPKAAIISHARYFMMASSPWRCFGISPSDTLYVMMPLYHTAAGILGIGQTIMIGATSVIRKKFSSSRFWDDCVEYRCTVSQYIGEICRYLLAQPFKEEERKHNVRMMFGNGLRAQIWEDFMKRFGVSHIGEFYGATEGNASLVNIDNKIGACGFLPIYPFPSSTYPVRLIKVDESTGQPVRDENGLCVKAKRGECGEMVGKVVKGNPLKDFVGYVSTTDTNKKLIRDVFTKGDVSFSSGDILYMDEKGYVFFKDRTGDTFRWKGENVSTTEVEGVVQKAAGLKDATVFGVEIPNMDGRAGMAAIVDESDNIDLTEFTKKVNEILPSYAVPVFVRLCKEVETTGTYKLKKGVLQKQSFDPSKCGKDKLFYRDMKKNGTYQPLTMEVFENINGGNVKF